MNLQHLIGAATHGTLRPEDLDMVVKCLREGTCDPYQALLIIGRSGAKQYRELVESYLESPGNPMLARLALMILCKYWRLSTEYRDHLEAFARKVEWDDEEDVRLLAINTIGSLLAKHEDPALLQLLIRTFRDESELQIVREAAYMALALAFGKSILDLPRASRSFDLEREVDPDVIARIVAIEKRNVGPQ